MSENGVNEVNGGWLFFTKEWKVDLAATPSREN